MTKCYEVMTENPVCCLGKDPVDTVAQRMQSENIGALPVVDSHIGKRLIGIVTDRDLTLRVVAAGLLPKETRIADVMTPNPVYCSPTDDFETAIKMMADHQVRRVPTVDSNGQIVGIIAQADVATRVGDAHKTAAVVEGISQPTSLHVTK